MRNAVAPGVVLFTLVVAVVLVLGGCGGGSSVGTEAAAVDTSSAGAVATAAATRTTWTQPAAGPGSAEYAHASYKVYTSGSSATSYTLYTPTSPVPTTAPVVVFNHGWSAITPSFYEAWLIHLVRKGNIVIFPRWQSTAVDLRGSSFLTNAATAVRSALERLDSRGPVKPDRTQVAVFGHSIGGVLAADMAAAAPRLSLPQAKVVFAVEPGTVSAAARLTVANDVTIADFSAIPAEVLLISLVGDADVLVGDRLARRIFTESTAVLAANKNLLTVRSDSHGRPALAANHLFPLAAKNRSNVDALDFYALWKIGDALLDAAFRGTNREVALGNTAPQRYMGAWADGTPVRELVVQ